MSFLKLVKLLKGAELDGLEINNLILFLQFKKSKTKDSLKKYLKIEELKLIQYLEKILNELQSTIYNKQKVSLKVLRKSKKLFLNNEVLFYQPFFIKLTFRRILHEKSN